MIIRLTKVQLKASDGHVVSENRNLCFSSLKELNIYRQRLLSKGWVSVRFVYHDEDNE